MATAFQPLSAGDKDQVVTLYKPSTVADEFGQHTEFFSVRNQAAKVEPLQGREFFAAAAAQSPASMRISIDWHPDVTGAWRVDWAGRHFQLVGEPIDLAARHRVLELMVQEVPK